MKKLVLLPGLDGTGLLFEQLLEQLGVGVECAADWAKSVLAGCKASLCLRVDHPANADTKRVKIRAREFTN